MQVDLVFEERTVQNYVVDDFDGIADLVVAGSDRWSRRQLNTFVVSGRVGRSDSSTDLWSPSRSLMLSDRFPTDRCFIQVGFRAKGK
jgi:hypothetical protein